MRARQALRPPRATPSPTLGSLRHARGSACRLFPRTHTHLASLCTLLRRPRRHRRRIAPPGFQSVGQTQTGQIYAVFDNFQAYPEWVIVYDPARVGGQQMAAPPPGAALGAALGAAAGWTGGAMTHSAMAALAGLVTLPPARAPRKGRR